MSKAVLFITYPFPPLAGGGVSRSVNLVRELPKNGINPVVLTIELSEKEKEKCTLDTQRLSELNEDLEVIRIPTRDPAKLKSSLLKILGQRFYSYLNFIFFPLLHTHISSWTFLNILKIRKIIKDRKFSIVYTTSPPHNQLFLGYFLKKTTKASWVADLRDPYTDGYQWHWPSKAHFRIAIKLEKLFLSAADKIIVNTPEVKRLYLARKITSDENISVITNGF